MKWITLILILLAFSANAKFKIPGPEGSLLEFSQGSNPAPNMSGPTISLEQAAVSNRAAPSASPAAGHKGRITTNIHENDSVITNDAR